MGDNLIPWFGGKLVDGEEKILLVPLTTGNETLVRSEIRRPFRVTRKRLSADYINQSANVDGKKDTRVYSQRGGGPWYVAGDDEDELSLRWWADES